MSSVNLHGSTSENNESSNAGSQTAASPKQAGCGSSSAALESAKVHNPNLDLVALSDVPAEKVKWLWPGRIPSGKLTVLVGDPGIGKSQVALDIAARVTTGKTMPPPRLEPVTTGTVLLLTAEDGPADTVRPRFEAAGGDPSRFHVFNGIIQPDGSVRLPLLPDDLAWLRSAVDETKADLLVIDPLAAYLSSHINAWKDQDVRRALAPLARLAEETGVAVLVVMHMNKATGQGAMYRAGGSIAFVAAARSVLLAAVDPDDDNLRVLAVLKSNLSTKPHSLAYRILPSHEASRVDWRGESSLNAETLLAEQARSGEKRLKVEDAKDALRDTLSCGRRLKDDVLTEGVKAGHKRRTLERAFEQLGGICTKDFGGPASWELPPRFATSSDSEHSGENPETETELEPGVSVGARESGLFEPCNAVQR